MAKEQFQSLPVKFEIQPFEDESLKKVKILVMHEGLNLNGSIFKEDAIEKARKSIENRPILAYVRDLDGSAEKDFKGHEDEIVIKSDGGAEYRYLGRPIGVIPSNDCDYHYEIYDDKKYVAVTGYIWTDYANEALGILERDGEKGQSMEIRVNESSFDESGNYIISDYKYLGLTLLGEGIQPAMEGAKVQMFSQENDRFEEMVLELDTILKKYSVEEVKEMENEVEQVEEETIITQTEEEIVTTVVGEESETVVAQNAESVAVTLTEDGLESSEEIIVEEPKIDENEEKIFKLNEKILDIEKNYNSMKSELEALKQVNAELESFKIKKIADEERAEKEIVLDKFSKAIKEASLNEIKENLDTYTLASLKVTLNELFTLENLKAYAIEEKSVGIAMDVPKKANSKSKYAV